MSILVYRRLRRGCALLVLAGLWPLAAPDTADAQSLVADRPDFTEATSTVGLGVFQLELGYTLGSDTDGSITTRVHSYGEPLLRVGVLSERLELRLGTGLVTHAVSASATVATLGLEDLYLGAKIALSGQRGVLPATAVLPQMTVPVGSPALSAGRTLPGINFLYAWDLSETLSLAGSTQVNAAVGDMDGEDYGEWAQSVSWGIATGRRSGVYAEWYAFVPAGLMGARAEHYLNSGLTWLANDDLQWDFRIGFGLNDAAEDMYVGAGVVMRVR